jgi:hypothetical protein
LIGFVLAFGFIRLSTRLMRSPRVPWWPGSVVSEDGVHFHHLFFGIVLMMAAGFGPGCLLAKPRSIWARRFYGERRPAKQARAEHRFRPDRRTERYKERLRDAIGGVTEEEYQAGLSAAAPTPSSTAGASAPNKSPSPR